MIKIKNYSILIVLIIFLQACIEKNSSAIDYQNVEITFLLGDKISGTKIPANVIDLIKPIMSSECTNSAIIGYKDAIHFIRFDLDSLTTLNINGDKTWSFSVFGEPSPEKKSENIDKAFSEVPLPSELIKEGTIKDSIALISNILKYVSGNKESITYIFEKDTDKDMYEGIKVFKSIDSLKNTIGMIACKNDIKEFFIVYGLPKSKASSPGPDSPDSCDTCADIRDILLNISNQKLSFDERMKAVDEAMQTIFSDDFTVESYINNIGPTPHFWDKGHGRKYLENLTKDRSILDFKILVTPHNSDDGKINHLQVVEIHN